MRISAFTKDWHLWPSVLQIKACEHDLNGPFQGSKNEHKQKIKVFSKWHIFCTHLIAVGWAHAHGLCMPGGQCCCTHTCGYGKMPRSSTMQGCNCMRAHTHHPHWSCSFSVHIACLLSCWKQLLTIAEEGFSIAMFLIENADSNQPDNLGMFFQCVAFTKLLKIWVRHKNTLFWCFQKRHLYSFYF